MTQNKIPLTIIGGYLGAGKTTLINRLLRHNEGRRLAVIVNDFGRINIDAELIESRDGDTINLANGCICCTLGGDLAMTLLNLAESANPPDHVIIEASGVADPAQVAQYGHMPGLRLDGVIVLADAEMVRQKARDKYVGEQVRQQLRAADVLLLNKVDLATPESRRAVRAWLAEQVPGARIVETVQGNAPLPLLLGEEGARPFTPGEQMATAVPPATKHHHDLAYETWSWEGREPVQEAAFRAFVAQLPAGVIRGKGILHLAGEPERRAIFQLVGQRWNLKPGEPWGDTPPQSRLALIGLPGSLDSARLAAAFEQMAGIE